MRNQSIFAALRGEKEPPERTPLYRLPNHSVVPEVKSNTTSNNEFYDEKNDPFEWVNIINDKNILAQKKELSKLMPKTEKKGVGNNGGKAEE
jgi:hypothetical protein